MGRRLKAIQKIRLKAIVQDEGSFGSGGSIYRDYGTCQDTGCGTGVSLLTVNATTV